MSADLTPAATPFDAIRHTTPEGREYWSARDLMPLLGYDQWRRFAEAISRARISGHNAGHDMARHIATAGKMVPIGSGAQREAEDFHLSRLACYLVAMNGDPRKPEVAAAQTYFAVRTREAETARAAAPAIPQTYAEALRAAADQAERAEKAEKQVEIEQRHRRAIEGGDGILLSDFGKKYFSEVRHTDFFEHLYRKRWLIDQRGSRLRPDGEARDGHDHRKPTYKGRPYIYEHDTGTHGGKRRFQPRVRPQKEIELRDALAAEGLPVNMHSTGLVLITNDELKGLGA